MSFRDVFKGVGLATVMAAVTGQAVAEETNEHEDFLDTIAERSTVPVLFIEMAYGRDYDEYLSYLKSNPEIQAAREKIENLNSDDDGGSLWHFDNSLKTLSRSMTGVNNKSGPTTSPGAYTKLQKYLGVCAISKFNTMEEYAEMLTKQKFIYELRASDEEHRMAVNVHEADHCDPRQRFMTHFQGEISSQRAILHTGQASLALIQDNIDIANIGAVLGDVVHATAPYLENDESIEDKHEVAAYDFYYKTKSVVQNYLKTIGSEQTAQEFGRGQPEEYIVIAAQELKAGALNDVDDEILQRQVESFLETFERRYPEYLRHKETQKSQQEAVVRDADGHAIKTRDGALKLNHP